MLRNYTPERFQVSKPLFELIRPYLGRNEETKQNVVMALWEYIKANDLVEQHDSRVVVANAELQDVRGAFRVLICRF